MDLYLSAKTNIPDVFIDFIEVKLKTGEEVSLNWEQSFISRSEDGFTAHYEDVYFGLVDANGKLADLEGFEITDIGLYFETSGTFEFSIAEMQFYEEEKTLSFSNPKIPQKCSGMEVLKPKSLDEKILAAAARTADVSSSNKAQTKEVALDR